jgi:hypothetical protein
MVSSQSRRGIIGAGQGLSVAVKQALKSRIAVSVANNPGSILSRINEQVKSAKLNY